MSKPSNNTVIITGASSGIGLGLAEAFLNDGYNVVGTSRSAERLQATAGKLNAGERFLALIASCLLCSTAVGADRPEKPAVARAGVKLYTLDCGHMEFKDMGLFADTGEYDGTTGKLTASCFVIKHAKGTLLWDSGLGDKIAETRHGIDLFGGQIHFSVPLTVASQLKEIGLAPADITYVSFSHLHLDHAGNANMFPSSTWILNSNAIAWATATPAPFGVDPSLFSGYKTVKTQMIEGDYDVFGDGTVRILKAPGHTPGHSVLELKLKKAGVVILSGDLSFTDPIPMEQEKGYAQQGIDAFHGTARFTGPDTVEVADEELKARFILIATGARPVPLGIPGQEHVITSDQFLELDVIPSRIVLIGGGYIAAEFSHIASRAGAHVTIFQRAARMLPAFDPDLVGWLMDTFHELGIDVYTRATVDAVNKTRDGIMVSASMAGHRQNLTADLAVHAAGRSPDLDALDLAGGNVSVDRGKLKLNEFLQSVSNPRIYAAGDAAQRGPSLTPVASHDGEIVAANLLEGNRHTPNYRGVPSVAFTIPSIAAVGLSEAAARGKGLKIRVNAERTSDWYTARRLNEPVYGFKTLIEEDTGRILGAHLVGPHVETAINLFGLAIRQELSADVLKSAMFAYPTGASDIGYML